MDVFANSTNILIALIGALGALLVFSAITGVIHPRGDYRDIIINEDDEYALTLDDSAPILDRLFGRTLHDLAGWLANLLGNQERDAALLLQAGYPSPFNTLGDFYAWKVILSVGFFVLTLFVVVFIGKPTWLPVSLAMGIYGLFMPDLNLKGKIKERQEGFEIEMAFTMDRLAMLVQAGESVERSLRHIAAGGGSYFIVEMRNVADLLNTRISLNEALEDVIPRFPLESYESLVSAIMMSLERGTRLHKVLNTLSRNMQSRMENDLLAKGKSSTIPMVLGMGLSLIAIFLAIGGPAAYIFVQSGL